MFALMTCLCVNAQIPDASTSNGRPDPNRFHDLPDPIKETLAKQRIKNEEKEYQELLQRGEEAAKLSEELNKSLENTQNLASEDIKKLERLEKLVKKIREELGAKDDGIDNEEMQNEKPPTLFKALNHIKEGTANLLSEIKKAGRHSISVIAIESSNSLLKLVRFIRFNKK